MAGCRRKSEAEWFTNCGARFLRPTIDLIAPKVVVTLGEWAYRATTTAYGVPRVAFRQAVERRRASRWAMAHATSRCTTAVRAYSTLTDRWCSSCGIGRERDESLGETTVGSESHAHRWFPLPHQPPQPAISLACPPGAQPESRLVPRGSAGAKLKSVATPDAIGLLPQRDRWDRWDSIFHLLVFRRNFLKPINRKTCPTCPICPIVAEAVAHPPRCQSRRLRRR